MKITQDRLRQIIKEELNKVLQEEAEEKNAATGGYIALVFKPNHDEDDYRTIRVELDHKKADRIQKRRSVEQRFESSMEGIVEKIVNDYSKKTIRIESAGFSLRPVANMLVQALRDKGVNAFMELY